MMLGNRRLHAVIVPVTGAYLVCLGIFALFPPPEELAAVWPPQFFLLLGISYGLCVALPLIPRPGSRAIALSVLAGMYFVMAVPSGPGMELRYALASIVVYLSFVLLRSPWSYVSPVAYLLVSLALARPLVVWDFRLDAPTWKAKAIYTMYVLFLGWIVRKVGDQASEIADLKAQIDRLGRTVSALSEANLGFQDYASSVRKQSQDEERKRVTREIHDIVGYTLMNLQMMMEAAIDMSSKPGDGLRGLLAKARDQAQLGLMETRRVMRSLRALVVPEETVTRRLLNLARLFENATGVRVEFNVGNCPESLGAAQHEALYRMVQEGLTNAFRHGAATEVIVNLWAIDDVLRVAINDNGNGAKEITPGIGLTGMVERLGPLGGTLKTDSTQFGFRVTAEIPLKRNGNG